VFEVLYHYAKFGGAWTSLAAGAAKTFCFCLILCMSITLLNDNVCVHDFTMKPLEYRNDFETVGWRRFVVMNLRSTFSVCCQLTTRQNAKFQKTAKFGVFSHSSGTCRINRSRRNLARKHRLWVNSIIPNLALKIAVYRSWKVTQ